MEPLTDPNPGPDADLMNAGLSDDEAAATLALQNGASMHPTGRARQPVHQAVADGSFSVLEAGAHFDGLDANNMAPLHVACARGRLDVARWLHEEGSVDALATPFAGDEKGYLPIHYAARAGSVELLDYLVNELHVPIDAPSKNGSKPVDCAGGPGGAEMAVLMWMTSMGQDIASSLATNLCAGGRGPRLITNFDESEAQAAAVHKALAPLDSSSNPKLRLMQQLGEDEARRRAQEPDPEEDARRRRLFDAAINDLQNMIAETAEQIRLEWQEAEQEAAEAEQEQEAEQEAKPEGSRPPLLPSDAG